MTSIMERRPQVFDHCVHRDKNKDNCATLTLDYFCSVTMGYEYDKRWFKPCGSKPPRVTNHHVLRNNRFASRTIISVTKFWHSVGAQFRIHKTGTSQNFPYRGRVFSCRKTKTLSLRNCNDTPNNVKVPR